MSTQGTTPPQDTVPVVRFTVNGVEVGGRRMAPAGPEEWRPYTVVYDGACRICTRLARTLARWDTRDHLEIIPSQTSGVHARFPWIPVSAYAESLQLIGPEGKTWQGAAAIEELLNVLPKGRLVSWIFSIPFVRPLADRLYRWFARNRYRLGCGEHCQYRPLRVDYHEQQD